MKKKKEESAENQEQLNKKREVKRSIDDSLGPMLAALEETLSKQENDSPSGTYKFIATLKAENGTKVQVVKVWCKGKDGKFKFRPYDECVF